MGRLGLALDGGGILGVIMARFLRGLERVIQSRFPTVRLCQLFDLIIGTSTGTFLGSYLASGGLAREAEEHYRALCPRLFGSPAFRNLWIERPWKGTYDREKFKAALRGLVPSGKMRDLQTLFVAVAECKETGEPHFFKSDDTTRKGDWRADAELTVMECCERSGLSAPLYFTPVDDEERGLTWIDGGSGLNNCPLEEAIMEAIRRGWVEEGPVKILSLGTGYSSPGVPHEKAKNRESWQSVADFLPLARAQAESRQMVRVENGWSRLAPNVEVKRVTLEIPRKENRLDAVEFMDRFVAYGDELAKRAEEVVRWMEVGGER